MAGRWGRQDETSWEQRKRCPKFLNPIKIAPGKTDNLLTAASMFH